MGGTKGIVIVSEVPPSEGITKGTVGLTGGLLGANLPSMPERAVIVGISPTPALRSFPPAPPIPPTPATSLKVQGVKLSIPHMAKLRELCKAHEL